MMNEFTAMETAYPRVRQAGYGGPLRGPNAPQNREVMDPNRVQAGAEAQDAAKKDVVDLQSEARPDTENRESEPELYGLVKEMNQAMTSFTSLRFSVDVESKTYVVSIVDEETDEVVRQIPSDNMADLAERMRDLEGLLFDVKA